MLLILYSFILIPAITFYLAWLQGKEDGGIRSGHAGGRKGVNKL